MVANYHSKDFCSYSVPLFIVSTTNDNYAPFIILIGIILFLSSLFFIVSYLKPLFSSFYKELLLGFTLATFCFVAPTFQYVIMLLFSGIVFILSFTYIDSYIPARKQLALVIFELFNQINLLYYLESIYFKFFGQEQKSFFIQSIFIYTFCILYVLISKYIFLNQSSFMQNDYHILLLLYLFLFICSIMVYLRLLLTASIISHNISFSFLKTEDLPNDEFPSHGNKNPVNSKPENIYSFLSFRKTINNNQYHQASTNAFRYRAIGLGIGACTLCIGGYAAYQQRLQTIAAKDSLKVARESVRAQEINNREMSRQNDLEEVSQGLMSKESYTKKYPPNK